MNPAKKRILVVDNDPAILEVTKVVLEEMGHHEVITCGEQDFNEHLQNPHPDLVILDYGLYEPATKDIYQRLKTDQSTKNLPVVIFSTNMDIENVSRSIGADDYISKPFNINSLLDKVHRLVER